MTLYIVRIREHIRLDENVFKIGKTKQEMKKRMAGYPKNSEIIHTRDCADCDDMEKWMILRFRHAFKHRSDIGAEYFECSRDEAISLFDLVMEDPLYQKISLAEIRRQIRSLRRLIPVSKEMDKFFSEFS